MRSNTTSQDCTIYAMTGTAILAISLVMALYVGNDFHQSPFVESVTFLGCNILLWAIFLSMVNCSYELLKVWSNGKAVKPVQAETNLPEQALQKVEPVVYTHEDYVKCVEAQEKEEREEKARMSKTILDYCERTMSRFLSEEDTHALVGEVGKWLEDSRYVPISFNRFKKSIKNIPLRHFVWNIAERLGKRKYDTKTRIRFMTALFPQHFETLQYETLKNLRAPCAKDLIPIDDPEKGKCVFHDKIRKKSDENPE